MNHFLDIHTTSAADLRAMINSAHAMKSARNSRPKGTPDDDQPLAGRMVALINCMWCGGVSGAVYLPESTPYQREAAPGNPVNAGDTLAETAMREELAETAALAEQDARNAQHPDYCTKCHSFCYGDCEASH